MGPATPLSRWAEAPRARNKGLARSLVSNEPGEFFSFDRAKTAENSPKSTDTGGFRSDFLVVVQRSAFGASFKTVLLPKSSFQRTFLRALEAPLEHTQRASPPSLAHTSTKQLATYLLAPAGYAAWLQSSDPDGLRDCVVARSQRLKLPCLSTTRFSLKRRSLACVKSKDGESMGHLHNLACSLTAVKM